MVFSQFYFRAISLIPDLACMRVPGLYSHGVFSQSLTFLDQIQTYFRGSGLNFIFNFYQRYISHSLGFSYDTVHTSYVYILCLLLIIKYNYILTLNILAILLNQDHTDVRDLTPRWSQYNTLEHKGSANNEYRTVRQPGLIICPKSLGVVNMQDRRCLEISIQYTYSYSAEKFTGTITHFLQRYWEC